jgi:nucleotide-binding universal stress UspA family protein
MSDAPTTAAGRGLIERVIVPLDAASEHRAAIDTAARLAARAGVPLHGIFVEDEDLLNVASLPFTRQTTLGAPAEDLTTSHVELHLRVAAERARGELLAAARRHRVEASFEIVRGASDTVLAAASERDLVVAGGLTRPIGAHFRMTCRWWSALEAARGPLLLARHAWSTSGSVVLLLRDRDAASVRLFEAAAQAAAAADRDLTVICPPAVAGAAGFDEWIADRLAGHPVRLQIEVGPAEPAALYRRIGELDCRLLAVEAGLAEGGGERLRELCERFACDILVVR